MNSPFVYLTWVCGQFDVSGNLYPVSYGTVVKGNALPIPVIEPRSIVLVISGTTLFLLCVHYCATDWQVRSVATHDLHDSSDQ
jgi:hypothetical protein